MTNTPKWGKLGGSSGRMHAFKGVGEQKPGGTSQEGSGARRDSTIHAGPTGQGYSPPGSNKSFAGTQTPGQSAAQPTGDKGGFAKGGKTSMFGPRGSVPAKGGSTAP